MNTLKRKPGRPAKTEQQPQPAAQSNSTLEFMRRINSDANTTLASVFPEEMSDPESAKTLALAFTLGVRLGVTQLRDMAVNPVADAATQLSKQLLSDRQVVSTEPQAPAPLT